MNKKDLINAVSAQSGQTKAASEAVLDSLVDVVEKTVAGEGEVIRIPGFGTFSRKDVAARTARNPRTGEAIAVPAKQKVVFKFSKGFGEN